jgi:hypothetical protein
MLWRRCLLHVPVQPTVPVCPAVAQVNRMPSASMVECKVSAETGNQGRVTFFSIFVHQLD